MRMKRAAVATSVLLVALALTGCAAQTPPQLAQLTAHVNSETIVAPTTGRGDHTLTSVSLRPGARVGIEASCAGVSGSVTVTLPSGQALTADCPSDGGQEGSAEYDSPVPGIGRVTVTTSSRSVRWNASVFYVSG